MLCNRIYHMRKLILALVAMNCFIVILFLWMTINGQGQLYDWFVDNGYVVYHNVTNLSNITYVTP